VEEWGWRIKEAGCGGGGWYVDRQERKDM